MICLICRAHIEGPPPLTCSGCEFVHESRPPVGGINHMSHNPHAWPDTTEGETRVVKDMHRGRHAEKQAVDLTSGGVAWSSPVYFSYSELCK